MLLWSATTSCQFHQNFHFTWKKTKWLVAAQNLQSIKTLLTLELSQYRKSGSTFSTILANAETPCVCASLSCQSKQSWKPAPRAWPLILPSKPLITFWNSLWRDCQMTFRAQTWTQTCTLQPDQRVVRVLSLQNYSINCVEFEFFISVTNAKFEPKEVTFLRLMPSAGHWGLWY